MSSTSATERRRGAKQLRRVCAAVAFGLSMWLVVWLIGAVAAAREAARQTMCRGHLCALKTALLSYHDVYGSFPPAYVDGPDGRRWHSWRTLLLPFVDQQDAYDQYDFNEPWDGPHNRRLAERTPIPWLQCPSCAGFGTTSTTNYVAVVGAGTVFPGATTVSEDAVSRPDETILFVESDTLNPHWTEPRDLDLATMSLQIDAVEVPSISSPHNGGAHVMHVGDGCRATLLTPRLTESKLLRRLFVTPETQNEDFHE